MSRIIPVGRERARSAALGGILLTVLLVPLSGCQRERGGGGVPVSRDGRVGVSMERAAEVSWSEPLESTADLQPLRRAMPGTVMMGRVIVIRRKEGDRVASGEILAKVESRDVEARLAQAEAGVGAASAQELNARLTRERIQRLHNHNATSQKNLDDANAGYDAALAGLKAAEQGAEAARVMLDYSKIISPFAGIITQRHVEVGDTTSPGMPLFAVEDTTKMKLEASVPESWLPRLKVGSEAEVDVEGAGGGVRNGTISQILPSVDSQSRTFIVRILLENKDGALCSGMFARVRIRGIDRKALAVPDSSIVRRGGLTGIFVADERGIARLRWVTLGGSQSGRVEVMSGLKAGESYVLVAPPELMDGMRVEPR
jgi:RND family efflux transporter MFP subunit